MSKRWLTLNHSQELIFKPKPSLRSMVLGQMVTHCLVSKVASGLMFWRRRFFSTFKVRYLRALMKLCRHLPPRLLQMWWSGQSTPRLSKYQLAFGIWYVLILSYIVSLGMLSWQTHRSITLIGVGHQWMASISRGHFSL